jgi:hypothetical protein
MPTQLSGPRVFSAGATVASAKRAGRIGMSALGSKAVMFGLSGDFLLSHQEPTSERLCSRPLPVRLFDQASIASSRGSAVRTIARRCVRCFGVATSGDGVVNGAG